MYLMHWSFSYLELINKVLSLYIFFQSKLNKHNRWFKLTNKSNHLQCGFTNQTHSFYLKLGPLLHFDYRHDKNEPIMNRFGPLTTFPSTNIKCGHYKHSAIQFHNAYANPSCYWPYHSVTHRCTIKYTSRLLQCMLHQYISRPIHHKSRRQDDKRYANRLEPDEIFYRALPHRHRWCTLIISLPSIRKINRLMGERAQQ